MDKISLKEATTKDSAIIALLGRITFSQTFEHTFRDKNDLINYLNDTFSVQKIRNSIKKVTNVFWIIYVNKLPVGYSKLKLSSPSSFLSDKNPAQLQKIYILKDFLKLGLGEKMMGAILNRATKNSNNCIWLSVLHTNEKAIQFYFKNKFLKIGNHYFAVGKENFYFDVLYKTLN